MKIHQHIYTKVSADKSPHKKNGFQSLYYPLEFLQKKNVLDIESKIHFNGTEGLRKSVFYEKIGENFHQIISYMVPLPHIKDEFGRSGMFLVHSFIIPSELWTKWNHPFQLDEYFSQIYIKDFPDIENYAGINKQTGDLAPLELPESAISPEFVKPILSVNEKIMFNIMYRIALKESDTLALAIQGKPNDIENVLNKLVACLPKPLWTKIGWHSAFDEGKIFFFPLKIVGFEKTKPITGEPVTFILDNNAFESGQQTLLKPTSTFQNWVLTNDFNNASTETLNKIYELSEFLEDRMDIPQQPLLLDSFLEANNQEFNRLLNIKLQSIVGNDWANTLSRFATPQEAVQLMLESMNKTKVALLLESITLAQSIDLKKQTIPQVLQPYLTPQLQFLQNAIQDKGDFNLLLGVSNEDLADLIQYLYHLKLFKIAWQTWLHYPQAAVNYLEIVIAFKKYIAEMTKTPHAIQDFLADSIYKEKRFSECLQCNWKWEEITDHGLSQSGWDIDIYPDLEAWVKKNKYRNEHLPWLECLIYAGKPSKIIKEQASYSVILCWVKYLKMKPEEIIESGFDANTVNNIYKKHAPGLFNKIKRFIGF